MNPPVYRSILHPTDLSADGESAFAHALAATLLVGGQLTVLHIDPSGAAPRWDDFPHVRATLARWGVLPADAPRASVARLGMRVEKVQLGDDDAVSAVVDEVWDASPDLLVMTTHARQGIARWLRGSVAEPIARRAPVPTLLVPVGAPGLVDADTGQERLCRIVVGVDADPDPRAGLDAVARLVRTLRSPEGVVEVVHAGDESSVDAIGLATVAPELPGWSWVGRFRDGHPLDVLAAVAEESDADLVVTVTRGHDGLLDDLLGSTTERLLRAVGRPLLSVPAL